MSHKEGAAPPPKGVVPNLEHPTDVLHTINLVSQILSITLVSVFMLLRLYAKIYISPPFHRDDWTSIVAWMLSIGYASTALVMYHYGGGFHIYEISKEDFVGFNKLTSFSGLYADTLVYGPNSFFTKLALLLIVLRVFRMHKKTVFGTYAAIAFMACYYLPVFFLKMFVCRPIAGYWDPTIKATCFNQRAIFVADTAVSAVTDVAVLCLPIPVAMTLRMSWTRRLKVIAMLSAGGIATAASIVRMVLVVRLQNSEDAPVDFIRFNLLGTAEISIGMICACLPAVNIILTHGFDCSPDSSRNTGGSSSIFGPVELKFLTFRGSKFRTQHLTALTAVEVEPVAVETQVQTRQETGDCIFPIERLSRLPSAVHRGAESGGVQDVWYSKVVSSPFSEPGSPDWARKGSEATV